jgi:hypothetical protein
VTRLLFESDTCITRSVVLFPSETKLKDCVTGDNEIFDAAPGTVLKLVVVPVNPVPVTDNITGPGFDTDRTETVAIPELTVDS